MGTNYINNFLYKKKLRQYFTGVGKIFLKVNSKAVSRKLRLKRVHTHSLLKCQNFHPWQPLTGLDVPKFLLFQVFNKNHPLGPTPRRSRCWEMCGTWIKNTKICCGLPNFAAFSLLYFQKRTLASFRTSFQMSTKKF